MPSFQVIRPEQVGPIPDDLTTDVGEILAYAFQLAAGKTIELSKQYYTTRRLIIPDDITIRFTGKGEIKSSLPRVLYGRGIDNVTIYKPKLSGPGSEVMPSVDPDDDTTAIDDPLDPAINGGTGGGIHLIECSTVRIYDPYVSDFYNGIAVNFGSDCQIVAPNVRNFRLYGVLAASNIETTIRGGVIKDSEQTGTKNSYGIASTHETAGAGKLLVDGVVIDNVHAWDALQSHGIEIVKIVNCTFTDVRMAIDLSGFTSQAIRDVVISNNKFVGTTTDLWGTTTGTPGNPGIQISGLSSSFAARRIHIHDNTLSRFNTFPPSASGSGAIILVNAGGFHVHNNILEEIGDVGSDFGAIQIYQMQGNGNIHDNDISIVATAPNTGANTSGINVTNSNSPTCNLDVRDNTVSNADTASSVVKVTGSTLNRLRVIANPGDSGMTHFTESGNTIADKQVVATY